MRRPILFCLAAAASIPVLIGCEEARTDSREVYEPSAVHEVAGGKQVTFTERGAAAVGLTLGTSGRQGLMTTVPYEALIYDGDGVPFVYLSPKHLTFQRIRVDVLRVEGNHVLLSSGLAPGSRVVTVGASEVYGSELGIAGKH